MPGALDGWPLSILPSYLRGRLHYPPKNQNSIEVKSRDIATCLLSSKFSFATHTLYSLGHVIDLHAHLTGKMGIELLWAFK